MKVLSWLIASVGLSVLASLPLVALGLIAALWRSRTRPFPEASISVVRALAVPVTLVWVAVFTLRPGGIEPGDSYAVNLEPFRDLSTSLASGHLVDIAVQNLLGNAAMFVPVGFVTAWAIRVHPGLTLIGIALLAVIIEIGQANPGVGRSSDITDAIMNTVGGAIGIAAFAFVEGRRAAGSTPARSVARAPNDG